MASDVETRTKLAGALRGGIPRHRILPRRIPLLPDSSSFLQNLLNQLLIYGALHAGGRLRGRNGRIQVIKHAQFRRRRLCFAS